MESFEIGRDATRVGTVVFSENAQLVFDMNRYQTKQDIQNAIMRDVPYLGTFTNFAGMQLTFTMVPGPGPVYILKIGPWVLSSFGGFHVWIS